MSTPTAGVVVIDAADLTTIHDAAVAAFRRDGLLVLRNVLASDELAALRSESAVLLAEVEAGRVDDVLSKPHEVTGEVVPFRVEYVVDKLASVRLLLAHPFLLRAVAALQGPRFLPTWDSMVWKRAGAGAAIPWHRDGGLYPDPVPILGDGRVFNVDVYLDDAGPDSCLFGIPGSNRWDTATADATVAHLNDGGVSTEGTVPIPMRAGDVLLHNVLVLHGSKATAGDLRRVVYLEFRPVDIELAHGPHNPAYVDLKQRMLAAAVQSRRDAHPEEEAYEIAGPAASANLDAMTWRYPHEAFWRRPPGIQG